MSSEKDEENIDSKNNIEGEDDEMREVEVEDRGMNTDELPPEELQRLVDNNIELKEENISPNVEHETKNDKGSSENKISKEQLINELNEKDKIFELLVKTNNQLKNKIELSNKKYEEILAKIDTKKSEDIENNLNLQIKELNQSIKAYNSETERYKKKIDQLKTKIEFKENLDRVSSIQYILKQEMLKNKDLTNELNALKRINKAQEKYIENYNKENQVSEKLDILKDEIKQNKDAIKDYQDKYNRLEKFIRLAHEKILSLEMSIKKIKEPKLENKKMFTKEELKDTLELITNLKEQINDKRIQLNNINKESDEKMHKLLAQNKQIELEYKENEKYNKMLINKRNELKRNIKNINPRTVNSIKLRTKLLKFNISSSPQKDNDINEKENLNPIEEENQKEKEKEKQKEEEKLEGKEEEKEEGRQKEKYKLKEKEVLEKEKQHIEKEKQLIENEKILLQIRFKKLKEKERIIKMKEYLINKKLSEYGKTKMYKTKIHLGKKEKMNTSGKYIKKEKIHNSKEMKKENTESQKNELESSKLNMDEEEKVNEGKTKEN
jgi:hypothetical protein